MEPVEPRTSLKKHERALAGHDGDSVRLTELDGPRAHSSLAARAIHPHPLDARVGAILHNMVGGVWRGHKQYAVNRRPNASHIRRAALAFDVRGLGIDGNNVVATVAKLAKQRARKILGIARNADNRDPFLGEKILDSGDRGHANLLPQLSSRIKRGGRNRGKFAAERVPKLGIGQEAHSNS